MTLDVEALRSHLDLALAEDHARADVTAEAVVADPDRRATADVIARASGTLAGLPLAAPIFRMLDPEAVVTLHYEDGEGVGENAKILTVEGRARALLSAERTVLDFIGHLSGVATMTAAYVEAAMGTGVDILDTRKTTPGWRALEKYAVTCGGGVNHRMHLEDAAMIKENHLYAAFGRTGPDAIREAAKRCRAALPEGRILYVEVENLEELEAAIEAGADVAMLDGFDLGLIRQAVKRVREVPQPRPTLEITGGVNLENVGAYAATGVTRISIGRLTHSSPQLDVSMRVRGDAS